MGRLAKFHNTYLCDQSAWETEVHNWWRLPLKSLSLLGITASVVFVGMAAPVLITATDDWLFPPGVLNGQVLEIGSYFIPLAAAFVGLSLFYKLSPRRLTRFSEIWIAALSTTVLLFVGESLFVVYLNNFATLNAVYGAFGGIMALLMRIYLSGCFFIFGACLCSSQAERKLSLQKAVVVRLDNKDNE